MLTTKFGKTSAFEPSQVYRAPTHSSEPKVKVVTATSELKRDYKDW